MHHSKLGLPYTVTHSPLKYSLVVKPLKRVHILELLVVPFFLVHVLEADRKDLGKNKLMNKLEIGDEVDVTRLGN